MENKHLVTISRASEILGVAKSTLRRWEKEGKLEAVRTEGGHRRYDLSRISPTELHLFNLDLRKTVAYARVSSHDQKADLERQKQLLELYCAGQGWSFEMIADLGSGMNYHKKGLQKLLAEILDDRVGRLVLTHKDRLLRFGVELVFDICQAKNVEVVIINTGDESQSFEEELAQDVLEIITVFSARLYGSRSHKNKKLLDDLKQVTQNCLNDASDLQ